MTRPRSRRTAWIAFFALAALVFGPTVSRALAAAAEPAAAAHVHCDGMPDAAEAAGDGAAHHDSDADPFESCGLCVVATLPALQAAPATAVPARSAPSKTRATRHAASEPSRPTWSPASPRGPPRTS